MSEVSEGINNLHSEITKMLEDKADGDVLGKWFVKNVKKMSDLFTAKKEEDDNLSKELIDSNTRYLELEKKNQNQVGKIVKEITEPTDRQKSEPTYEELIKHPQMDTDGDS